MKKFAILLAVLLFASLPQAQTGIGPPNHTGNVSVLDDETLGTLPIQGGPTWTLHGPGMNTLTSIGASDSTMHSTWRGAGGITHGVTTPRQQGETVTAQAQRHAAAVNALQLVFPPVPVGG